jgi:two-component system phosphate regulon response regulator PhoB
MAPRGRFTRPQHPPTATRRIGPWTASAAEPPAPASGAGARVLVADGDREGVALAAYHLAANGYRVSTALRGAEALAEVARERPDFLVLGARLPDVPGLEVLRRLRLPGPPGSAGAPCATLPVLLVLGGEGDRAAREAERLDALALGADDVLDRPLVFRELLLRMSSILRRVRPNPLGARALFELGALRLDVPGREATVDGVAVALTRTEFGLLHALAEHAGRVRSRAELSETLWGERAVGRPRNRALDIQLSRLRAKLGRAAAMIETVRREGYRLQRPAGPVAPSDPEPAREHAPPP